MKIIVDEQPKYKGDCAFSHETETEYLCMLKYHGRCYGSPCRYLMTLEDYLRENMDDSEVAKLEDMLVRQENND